MGSFQFWHESPLIVWCITLNNKVCICSLSHAAVVLWKWDFCHHPLGLTDLSFISISLDTKIGNKYIE